MKKIKQTFNNAFRPDRTEVLSENLLSAERRIEQMKMTCDTLARKVHACLQARGKEVDKRIPKVPVYVLGSAMASSSKGFVDGPSMLGDVLGHSSEILMKLGQTLVESEMKIEEQILKPLTGFLDNDFSNVSKLKRALTKASENLEVAKGKLHQVSRHSSIVVTPAKDSSTNKIDATREECEEAQQKMDAALDAFATEVFTLIARESEISQLVLDFLRLEKEHFSTSLKVLEELVPNVESALVSAATRHRRRAFGEDLAKHLENSGRIIAYPVELCVCALVTSSGFEEEGLFRIAGAASKVKKVKSALDAGLMDLNSEEACDPHVMANVLKCYLRELPDPLLTAGLYTQWIEAISVFISTRNTDALLPVVKMLPRPNYDNLRYLVKFLRDLSNHSATNKMTAANISICVAPNLLWQPSSGGGSDSGEESSSNMGMNMALTQQVGIVLEQMITNYEKFFPEDIEYFLTYTKPSPEHEAPKGLPNGSATSQTRHDFEDMKRSQSNSSLDQDHEHEASPRPELVIRRKNKPAPTPPKNPLAQPQLQNQQAKPTPFSGQSYSKDKEDKREGGVWVPPSPKELSRKPKDMAPPAKPPPPKESQLKYKSSFKDDSSGEKKSTGSEPNYASLPRHFSSDGTKKVNGKPARPPSMFGIAPPAPPVVPSSPTMPQTQEKVIAVPQPGACIGFEKVEAEIRKGSSGSSEDEKPKEKEEPDEAQVPVVRPVPAPRSSLLAQSQSFKENRDQSKETTPRERPSIMAKPRDLAKRNLNNNIGVATSEASHHKDGSSSEDNADVPKTFVGTTSTSQPTSPTGKASSKPPRPQPPVPVPPLTKPSQESTDL